LSRFPAQIPAFGNILSRIAADWPPNACIAQKMSHDAIVPKGGIRGRKKMESDLRYYARRAQQEYIAARHALTIEARERRLALAASFEAKLAEINARADALV
jgi:hypothetical protein